MEVQNEKRVYQNIWDHHQMKDVIHQQFLRPLRQKYELIYNGQSIVWQLS